VTAPGPGAQARLFEPPAPPAGPARAEPAPARAGAGLAPGIPYRCLRCAVEISAGVHCRACAARLGGRR